MKRISFRFSTDFLNERPKPRFTWERRSVTRQIRDMLSMEERAQLMQIVPSSFGRRAKNVLQAG